MEFVVWDFEFWSLRVCVLVFGFGIWCLLFGVWSSEFGILNLGDREFGLGFFCLVFGVLVFGVCNF